MNVIKRLVKMSGVKVPLDKLRLPDTLYFWAAVEGPCVLTTPDYSVLPLFASPETLAAFYKRNLEGVRVVGGPDDGAQKEFKAATLDTVHDLKMLFEMARKSEYRVTSMAIDPPGPDERFEVTKLDSFLAYALERSETLYWNGRLD